MEKLKAEQLIDRIEDAKSWLEKAKNEYKNSNHERGGLILSLAQAEVKHAWELSHEQYVSKGREQQSRRQYYYPKIRYIIPIAASLVLITGLGVGVRLSGIFHPAVQDKTLPVAQVTSIPKTPITLKEGTAVTVKKTLPVAISETSKDDQNVAQARPTLNIQPTNSLKGNNTPISCANSLSTRTGTGIVEEKPVLKAVSKFSIDEDALTKEASHSLRIGK
jgi:hypothetical protein